MKTTNKIEYDPEPINKNQYQGNLKKTFLSLRSTKTKPFQTFLPISRKIIPIIAKFIWIICCLGSITAPIVFAQVNSSPPPPPASRDRQNDGKLVEQKKDINIFSSVTKQLIPSLLEPEGGCPTENLLLGVSYFRNLTTSSCIRQAGVDSWYYHRYRFYGRAGQQIAVSMNSSQFRTYMWLYPVGQPNIPGESSPSNNNSRVPASGYHTLIADGEVVIEAFAFYVIGSGQPNTGNYSINVSLNANSTCSRLPFTFDETRNGSLAVSDCISTVFANGAQRGTSAETMPKDQSADTEGSLVAGYAYTDEFTFQNTTIGRPFAIALNSTQFRTYMDVYCPNGQLCYSVWGGNPDFNSRLPGTGFLQLTQTQ